MVRHETPQDPREVRREALHSKIVEAALPLFAERGFHGTSIPEVMKRAGVGGGSLYRLFASKEALVNAVYQSAKGKLQRALTLGFTADRPPRVLFDDLWQRLAVFATSEPMAFRFLELQDHTPYLDGTSRSQEIGVLAPLALGCLEFQQSGAFRADVGPDVIIAVVWGAFVGLVKAARLGYLPLGPTQFDAARDACFRAFGPDGAVTTLESPRLPPMDGAEDGPGTVSQYQESARAPKRRGGARPPRPRDA